MICIEMLYYVIDAVNLKMGVNRRIPIIAAQIYHSLPSFRTTF